MAYKHYVDCTTTGKSNGLQVENYTFEAFLQQTTMLHEVNIHNNISEKWRQRKS